MRKLVYLVAPLLLLFTSCKKESFDQAYVVDEAQWLNRERAVVVESDFNCPYYVVEGEIGYSVLKSWGGLAPLRGSVMYGDFSNWGTRTFYNRSEGYLIQGQVTQYWLSYWDAVDEMDYQCNY
jgi:hypothetical protein